MADKGGCPEYPAYVPYLSWGTKIHEYRLDRESEVSQAAFAKSIGMPLDRLQDLEADRAEPSYEEHQKFADLWCGGDLDMWWVRDQGFPPSTPSQDRDALRTLRRDHKKIKAARNRYRSICIEALKVAISGNKKNMGQIFEKMLDSMEEFNDKDHLPKAIINLPHDHFRGMELGATDTLTRKQIKSLGRSWGLILEKADPAAQKLLKSFDSKLKKLGVENG